MNLLYAMCFFAEQCDSEITFCNFRSFPMARKLYLTASWFLLLHFMYTWWILIRTDVFTRTFSTTKSNNWYNDWKFCIIFRYFQPIFIDKFTLYFFFVLELLYIIVSPIFFSKANWLFAVNLWFNLATLFNISSPWSWVLPFISSPCF